MTNFDCKCVFYLDGSLDRSKCPAHFDADLFLSIMPVVSVGKLNYEKDCQERIMASMDEPETIITQNPLACDFHKEVHDRQGNLRRKARNDPAQRSSQTQDL